MMTLTRHLTLAATALGLAGTAVLTTPAVAQAGTYCPTNHACMWEDSNFQGDRWVDIELGAAPSSYDIDGWDGDNEISSIENGSTTNWLKVWSDDDYQGTYICVAPRAVQGSLGGFDNNAESFQLVSSC